MEHWIFSYSFAEIGLLLTDNKSNDYLGRKSTRTTEEESTGFMMEVLASKFTPWMANRWEHPLSTGEWGAHPWECIWERQNKIKGRKIEQREMKAIWTARAIKPLKSLPREVMETSLLESFQNRQSNGKCTAGNSPLPAGSGNDDLILLFCLSFPCSVKLYHS